jgi:C-terminal processing protease CtpA/Prc
MVAHVSVKTLKVTARFGLSVVALGVLSTSLACGATQRGTIGARLGRDSEGHVFVREVPEGLGAAEAGVKPGDELLLIDGQDVRELSESRLHTTLSGEEGTRIRLTLQRGNEVVRVTVKRTLPPSLLRLRK